MCTSKWLFGIPTLAVLLGCGSDLTLPGGEPPPGNPPTDDPIPAQLLAIGGNGQEARIGKRLDDPLVVRLLDQSARPIGGRVVEFRFKDPLPEGEIDPAAAETDANGEASVEVRLGLVAGQHQIEASLAAADLRATFDVIALDRGRRGQGHDGGDEDD